MWCRELFPTVSCERWLATRAGYNTPCLSACRQAIPVVKSVSVDWAPATPHPYPLFFPYLSWNNGNALFVVNRGFPILSTHFPVVLSSMKHASGVAELLNGRGLRIFLVG